MPCRELFDIQPQAYRNKVLPTAVKARVSMEAAATLGWHKYVGDAGVAIGIDRFGASAPYREIYKNFGMTAERMAAEAEKLLKLGRGFGG
jgi:transketolase